MKPFFPYLWFLLPRPFKRSAESEVRKLVRVLGSLFDDLNASVFGVRRAWVTETAQGQALDIAGADRTLHRWPGESDAAYRQRLLHAWETYQMGGTVPGIVFAIGLLGHDAIVQEPRIHRGYNGSWRFDGSVKYGGVQWALFSVSIEMPDQMEAGHLDALLRTIQEWKPAHTKLAWLLLDAGDWTEVCTADETMDLVVEQAETVSDPYAWPAIQYNGVHRFDGSCRFNGRVDTLEVEVLPAA